MFKTNFSGHNKIGEHCPGMPPLATSLPVKQKLALGWKYCCVMFLAKLK